MCSISADALWESYVPKKGQWAGQDACLHNPSRLHKLCNTEVKIKPDELYLIKNQNVTFLNNNLPNNNIVCMFITENAIFCYKSDWNIRWEIRHTSQCL